MDKASWHERILHWHNRPLAALLLKGVSLAHRGLLVPGVGYVVNDPELACQVLTGDAFRSSGHGSMDDVITGLVGPGALLNMDGQSHREMRNRLMDVFSRRNAAELVDSAGDSLLAEMRRALTPARQWTWCTTRSGWWAEPSLGLSGCAWPTTAYTAR